MKIDPERTRGGASSPQASTDGRALRSERSRQTIVAALFDLVGKGSLKPTAQQVAERAGVGIRTVFRHFSDMDTLYAELNARLREEILPLTQTPISRGDLAERARGLVALHAHVFERIAPYKRSGDAQRWHSPFLQTEHKRFVRELRNDLHRWLPELSGADPDTVSALEMATSFRAWDRLRIDQRLNAKRAASTIETAVLALLATLS
jgi:AcrR family transcriptional regulator